MTSMKKLLLIPVLLVTILSFAQMEKIISTRPNPPKLVNDYSGTLTPEQITTLENKLVKYDDSTSNQFAVVMVKSTEGYSLEDAAIDLGRSWGVGNKDFNNGLVILIATEDRKMTIQVGYGLEGAITDLLSKSIIDNTFTPNFKEGNYYRGIDEGVDDLIKAAEGRYQAPTGYGKRKSSKAPSIGTIIFIIIILIIIFGSGRGGGTYVSRGGYRGWGGLGGFGGLGGGGWSGGGGGSSGGGGFGGFGGGSFGGGGSSGSW